MQSPLAHRSLGRFTARCAISRQATCFSKLGVYRLAGGLFARGAFFRRHRKITVKLEAPAGRTDPAAYRFPVVTPETCRRQGPGKVGEHDLLHVDSTIQTGIFRDRDLLQFMACHKRILSLLPAAVNRKGFANIHRIKHLSIGAHREQGQLVTLHIKNHRVIPHLAFGQARGAEKTV